MATSTINKSRDAAARVRSSCFLLEVVQSRNQFCKAFKPGICICTLKPLPVEVVEEFPGLVWKHVGLSAEVHHEEAVEIIPGNLVGTVTVVGVAS